MKPFGIMQTIEFTCGMDIQDCVIQAAQYAAQLNIVCVRFDFNGTDVYVFQSAQALTGQEIVDYYNHKLYVEQDSIVRFE